METPTAAPASPVEPTSVVAVPVDVLTEGSEQGYDGLPLDPSLPIELKILTPQSRSILPTQEVDIFFSLTNYFLAEGGNRLHIIVDNAAPIIKTDIASPLTLKNLSQGGHTVRAMVVRPNGTMIQQPSCMATLYFYVLKKDFQNYTDPKFPSLTVNLPLDGDIEMDDKDRLCFDYFIHNPPVDGSACKIRYKLEGYEGFIDQMVGPIFWSEMPPGRHKLIIELFDDKGQPIFGVFNRVERVFNVRKIMKAQPVTPETTGLTDERPQ